jgi:hypothetical protein
MSSRLTKKSFVSVSGRLVETPFWDAPLFALRAGPPPGKTPPLTLIIGESARLPGREPAVVVSSSVGERGVRCACERLGWGCCSPVM